MSPHIGEIIRGTLLLLFGGGALLWFLWVTIKRAEDPARMAFRWVITAGVVTYMIVKVAPIVGEGGYGGAFIGIPLAAVCGLVLAITWRHALAALVAKPFTNLFDGGSTPPIPRPAYSVAQARQKQGRYQEAVVEIHKQLERFPTDFEGHILLAQIQAENLNDLSAAEMTILRLCAQPGHVPANIAFALYSMADWYLKYGRDAEAARRCLEQVGVLLPDSEFALTAAQRIAHLGGREMLLPHDERRKFTVTEGIQNLGIAKDPEPIKPAEKTPAELAVEYVKHLEQHPLDTDARERLAAIYVDYYHRLDLAQDQLEQMIQQPNRAHKMVVRWLNLLADFQLRSGGDHPTIKNTLERIVELDPNAAAAENARHRINILKLELRGKEEKVPVKMGTYEQNIGLKRARSQPPAVG